MDGHPTEFRRGAIRPIECYRAGWALVRGDYWKMCGIATVAVLLGSVAPLAILMGPMFCGMYLCQLRKMRGQPVRFEELFEGFQFFLQSVIATLIHVVPIVVLTTPLSVVGIVIAVAKFAPRGPREPNLDFVESLIPALVVGSVVVILLSIALGLLFTFVYPLIVDRGLTGVAAVKLSARAALANLGGVIGLFGLNLVLGLAGLVCCYVGSFLVLPLSVAAVATAYRQVFPEITPTAP